MEMRAMRIPTLLMMRSPEIKEVFLKKTHKTTYDCVLFKVETQWTLLVKYKRKFLGKDPSGLAMVIWEAKQNWSALHREQLLASGSI